MSNFPGSFGIGGQLWESRPKPLSTIYQGTKKGILGGALTGAAVGGIGGAAIGTGIGIALGTLAIAVEKIVKQFKALDTVTRSIVDHYKTLDPIMARINHQMRMADRRINRMWARTLGPLTRRLSDMSRDFQLRWEKMKIQLFETVLPYLNRFTTILDRAGKLVLTIFEKLTTVTTKVIDRITLVLKVFGLLPDEDSGHGITKKLKPFAMEWPTVEGPLSGAMKRIELKEPPFTDEKRKESRKRPTKDAKGRPIFDILTDPPLDIFGLKHLRELLKKEFQKKTEKKTDIKVDVKVGDSKELSAVFEQVWKDAAYKLRKVEAEETLLAFRLQNEGTFM